MSTPTIAQVAARMNEDTIPFEGMLTLGSAESKIRGMFSEFISDTGLSLADSYSGVAIGEYSEVTRALLNHHSDVAAELVARNSQRRVDTSRTPLLTLEDFRAELIADLAEDITWAWANRFVEVGEELEGELADAEG